MSRLTVRLPSTLHQQLVNLAQNEGVSLNQYIVYALTRQISSTYTVKEIPEAERIKQQESFSKLLEELGEAEATEIETILAQREEVEPESGLNKDASELLRERIASTKGVAE